MYPERLKYQTLAPNLPTENWSFSLKIKQILKIYSFFLSIFIFVVSVMWGFPTPMTTAVAWVLGIFSMILSIFQFIPQIHQTLKHKVKISDVLNNNNNFIGNRRPEYSNNVDANTRLFHLLLHFGYESRNKRFYLVDIFGNWLFTRNFTCDLFILSIL